jgi:large subunit ribosomal protein L25
MTTRPTLAALSREVTGKKVAHLRRAGRLPAVIFGHGLESTPVSVDAHEFDLLRHRVGPNVLVNLKLDQHRSKAVLIHGVQIDTITRRPVHVDLFEVHMSEELTVDVPLIATGVAPAAETGGGSLLHVLEHVRIRALPDALPHNIEYSVGSLTDFDGVIHVADLPVPAGVTILTEGVEVVARVLRPRAEEAVVGAVEPVGVGAPVAPASAEAAAS